MKQKYLLYYVLQALACPALNLNSRFIVYKISLYALHAYSIIKMNPKIQIKRKMYFKVHYSKIANSQLYFAPYKHPNLLQFILISTFMHAACNHKCGT